MGILLILAIIFPIIILIHLLKPKQKTQPDPKSILELIKNRHRLVEWTSDLITTPTTATVTTSMGVITADPAIVEHITKTKFESYEKGDHSSLVLKDFLGHGIFNADGEQWKRQRRTASLEFTTKVIRTFILANIHSDVSTRLLPALRNLADAATAFDVQDLLERFGFDNVCRVVFGAEPDSTGSREFREAFERAGQLCVSRFSSPVPGLWRLKRFLNVGSERELREKIELVHRFTAEVVKERKEGGGLGDDLLSRFVAEDGGYSEEYLRDVVISFVLAGKDTPAATLVWFVWEVGRRKEVEERILEEIGRVRRKDPDFEVFGLGQVREMEYMHAALSETLRLHPPVPLQPRVCTEDDVLPGGMKVEKGTAVYYNSYAMGRSRRLWGENWMEFRPERWLDGEGRFEPRSPYVYSVFHAGPRMCLGKDMAYVQMKVLAATIMERFEVEVVDKDGGREHELTLFMKMKGGLMVKVKERK